MLIELNQEIAGRLTDAELSVIKFINSHEDTLFKFSIVDIAAESYTSPATVSRAIRKCNVSGFNELRYKCIKKSESKSNLNIATEIMYKSLEEVQNIIESVSVTKISQTVEMIKSAEKILILGRGLSEYVAEEFSLILQLLNLDSMFIKDPNIMKTKSRNITENTLTVIFSLNGHTPELIESAKNINYNKGKLITCCCNPTSELVPLSDVSLIGYSTPYSPITEYEVKSRLPLYVISRMITEHLATSK